MADRPEPISTPTPFVYAMRTVEDEDGRRYLLVKASSDAWLVRDPTTGEERYLPADELAAVGGESPLAVAAAGVPEAVRRVVVAAHDDRSLGLLVELADRGPLPAVDVLGAYDYCESDLLGLLSEFRAAGLVREVRVHGDRGYDATAVTREAVRALRAAGAESGE